VSLPIVDDLAHQPTPTQRALDDVWRLAHQRLWSWRHTVRHAWLRSQFDLTFVKLSKLKIKVPIGSARRQLPDCDNCADLCCTGPNAVVSLRFVDIAGIVDAGHADHIVASEVIKSSGTWARREAAGSLFGRAFPVLRRDATQTCAFLTEERTCGAWPRWPLSCARYPYALDRQLGVIFYAKGCASHAVDLPVGEASLRAQRLAEAVVVAYNERVKDVVRLAFCAPELASLGLLQHLDRAALPWMIRF
jgi:Fe-S-cluster containining protein